MKIFLLVFVTLLSSALGAPAIVWQQSESSVTINEHRALHSSEDLPASDLINHVLSSGKSSVSSSPPLTAAFFLIAKGDNGSEQLSELASSGKLPGTFAKYNDATDVYHHVSGLESTGFVVRETGKLIDDKNRVLEVSLDEFKTKLSSLNGPVEVEIDSNGTPKATTTVSSTNKSVNKRARALSQADIYIVNVSPNEDSNKIDTSITAAIENKNVGSVVLGGIRSVEEVKHERFLIYKRRMLKMEEDGNKIMESRRRNRRRLEQEDAGDDAAQAEGNDDMAGVHYVAMTPNILSGLLFFFMFIFVAYTGISCMGDIQGGDTFTDKYPSLGRES